LAVRPGTVHGLIGPNGSGKTTLLNAVSGFYAANSGRIIFGEADLAGRPSADRAALGIARTFQTPRVVGNLSVLENAMLGAYRQFSTSFPAVALGSRHGVIEDRAIRQRAADALAAVGLRRLAHLRAEQLQHTEQRYLEIARCLVMQPSILLLDEPAAGLSHDEIEHLQALIEHIRSLGVAILLVEHHADLVFQVSDEVTVLDVGRVLAHGAPAEVRINPEVINAYLGA
jgi:ABC-type branched-subunit amino acid transport system ATPase component